MPFFLRRTQLVNVRPETSYHHEILFGMGPTERGIWITKGQGTVGLRYTVGPILHQGPCFCAMCKMMGPGPARRRSVLPFYLNCKWPESKILGTQPILMALETSWKGHSIMVNSSPSSINSERAPHKS